MDNITSLSNDCLPTVLSTRMDDLSTRMDDLSKSCDDLTQRIQQMKEEQEYIKSGFTSLMEEIKKKSLCKTTGKFLMLIYLTF